MKSNVEKLKDLVEKLQLKNFNVFKGPKWDELSQEERAGAILEAFEAIERGDVTEFDGLGDSVRGQNENS